MRSGERSPQKEKRPNLPKWLKATGATALGLAAWAMNSPESAAGTTPVTKDTIVFAYNDGAVMTENFSGIPSAGNTDHANPIVGITRVPIAGNSQGGYDETAANGQVFALGGAPNYGGANNLQLNAPVVGMASTPDGQGYWEVAADGGVFSYHDAGFYGSMGGKQLNAPIVGIAPTPDGHGYWEVASDGGVFAFGDANFYGSMGGKHLNAPVVGMAADRTGNGYWLVAKDGGVFAFGDAPYDGSVPQEANQGFPQGNNTVGMIALSNYVGGFDYGVVSNLGALDVFSSVNPAQYQPPLALPGTGETVIGAADISTPVPIP